MDRHKSRFSKPSNIDGANFISRLYFCHVYSIFAKGMRKNGLDIDDLPGCSVDDQANTLMHQLDKHWQVEKRKQTPSLIRALFNTFAKYYVVPFMMYTLEELFLFIIQPLLMGKIILHFNGDPSVDYKWACISAAGVVLTMLLTLHIDYPCIEHVLRISNRQKAACSALMYRKALRLSQKALKETTTAKLINLLSNDVSRLDEFAGLCSFLVLAPLQTCIIVYIVWTYLGWSSFVGVALLVLLIPFQSLMGKLFATVRMSTAKLTDTRLKKMNEIINGIRVLKMYSWERPFAERVADARKAEVSQIQKSCFFKAINTSIFFVVSRVIIFACFVVYVLLGNVLTSEAVFVSMALFNALRISTTLLFPLAVSATSEMIVSCKRIKEFLLLEEIAIPTDKNNEDAGQSEGLILQEYSSKIVVDRITARWTLEPTEPTLNNISVSLKSGDLLAVIGPVGSGKSSFLMSLLKELPLESGQIDLKGSISYSSQDAFSYNDSVRNNILFGMDFDDVRYQKVIEVCALERDLQLMPFGDRTLVGEKGVQLSGGQKTRLNLARAIYRYSDICLLDDPLSAVDAPVAKHIFDKCILGYLKQKVCILVTHQIQFIEKASKILILKEGKCLAYGTYHEIQQMGIDFVSLLEKNTKKKENEDEGIVRQRTESQQSDELTEVLLESKGENDIEGEKTIEIEEEQVQQGSIKGRIYWEYIRAGAGAILLSSMIVFTVISQTLFHGSDIFLTYWTNKNQNGTVTESGQRRDVLIYSVLIGALFVTTILRAFTFFAICMRASKKLHNKIFARLLRAPVAFFDKNPTGRILNRFTKDLGLIDESLPYIAFDLNTNLVQSVGVVITVSLVNWYLVLPALGLAVLIIYVRRVYIKSSLAIKRFEGLVRSPVYSHVITTMNGLTSIRAFKAQDDLERQFHVYLNDYSASCLLYRSITSAFGFAIELICIVYIAIITVSVMLSKNILGGDVGLAISSGLMLSGMTEWGVRQSAEFESQMTSVERIVEYKELPQEASAESMKEFKPSEQWPNNGQIEFEHVNLTYAGNMNKPVLKDINCTIKSGEKIGIVGRTGAGKSSIIAALFRLTEPTGAIRIDGVDIQSIGLDDLRKKISIIPQDPVIFSGTVRYNLDPFNEFPDSDLWSALEEVQLKNQIENYSDKLEAMLSDSGSNLSVGQRQLICLARAILRQNRILVLDEATANVDHQTDSLIQKTIRSKFVSCTALIVAHRLNTIIDCDRILVLDAGEILEFDSPYTLLKSRGAFFEMCQTGPSMYMHLYQLARDAYHRKHNGGDDC